MATDLIITAEKLNELKTKVRNEMRRRGATEHSASLFQYSESSWDYTNAPKPSDTITDEHIKKLVDPLLHVNDFLYDNSLKTNQNGIEMSVDKVEKFVDALSAVPLTATNSGCRGSCMGLCTEACTGQCTGCSSCSGGCSTTCSKACSSNCGGGCSGCDNGCHTGCTATCGSGCTTSLKY